MWHLVERVETSASDKCLVLLSSANVLEQPLTVYWRTGWDSNPRYPCRYAAFRVRYIQPLCHLSICGDMGTASPRQVLSTPVFSGPCSHRPDGEKGLACQEY